MNNILLKRSFEDKYSAFWTFSVLNLITRGMSILSGLFLHFYTARVFSIEEYGNYGIIYSSIIIGVYLIGLDIYVVTTRELPKLTDSYSRKRILYHQILLYLVSYAVILPTYLKLLWGKFVETHLIVLFLFLLLLEHFTQEFIRVFFALRYATLSNIIIFCRRILWVPLFLLATYFYKDFLSLKYLLAFWIIGDVLAMLGGIYYGFKIDLFPLSFMRPDINLVYKIIKSSLVFLGASVALKVSSYSGNYFIKYYQTAQDLGIFSFFLNMLNFIDILIYTCLAALFVPKIIEEHHMNDSNYKRTFRFFSVGIMILVVVASGVLVISIKPLLSLIGKVQFLSNLKIFYILLIGFIFFGLSNIPHYFLYINESEKFILYSSLIGCATNIGLNFLFVREYGMTGCAIAFLLSMLVLLFAKLRFSRLPVLKRISRMTWRMS